METGTEGKQAYSLVMTGFRGNSILFHEAAEAAFGRGGLDCYALCSHSPRRHSLPAEIATSLPHGEAERIAEALRAAGAAVEVIPSERVEGVLYRADECWPTRSVGDVHFTEVEGMIFTLPPISARRSVPPLHVRPPESRPWMIERFANHQHPTHNYSRLGLRRARERGNKLARALRSAYPDREFVLSYQAETYSFYQRGDGAPEVAPDEVPTHDHEAVYCETCDVPRCYQRVDEPDPEFSNAAWAICRECGGEILLEANEVLVVIGPGHEGKM